MRRLIRVCDRRDARLVPARRAVRACRLPRRAAVPPPSFRRSPIPTGPLYQHKGEQYRVYNFPGTGESIPYRLFVPSKWTPDTKLPMLVTLRAGNTVDGPYRAQNDLVKHAEQRGYIVVTPMGYRGLEPAVLRQPPIRSRAPTPRRPPPAGRAQENERAEQDVLYVIDLVAKEYNADPSRVYLHGQNPSGSGALHLAAKYPDRFAALVVSSAPIVYDAYPFDRIKGKMALLVIHGDQDTTNPIAGVTKDGRGREGGGRGHGLRDRARRDSPRGVSHLRVADLRLPGQAQEVTRGLKPPRYARWTR